MPETTAYTPESALDRLLRECFAGGEIRRRELRLTDRQARLLADTYSAGRVRPMGGGWYEIIFQEACQHVS